jgi:hypothetical protein
MSKVPTRKSKPPCFEHVWHLTTQLPEDESAMMKVELSQGPFTQLPGL